MNLIGKQVTVKCNRKEIPTYKLNGLVGIVLYKCSNSRWNKDREIYYRIRLKESDSLRWVRCNYFIIHNPNSNIRIKR